jgi:hypothetical protein
MGLAHLPIKRFGGNAAWLVLNTIVHDLTRWGARAGLGMNRATRKVIRRKIHTVGGRLTRTSRRGPRYLTQRLAMGQRPTCRPRPHPSTTSTSRLTHPTRSPQPGDGAGRADRQHPATQHTPTNITTLKQKIH